MEDEPWTAWWWTGKQLRRDNLPKKDPMKLSRDNPVHSFFKKNRNLRQIQNQTEMSKRRQLLNAVMDEMLGRKTRNRVEEVMNRVNAVKIHERTTDVVDEGPPKLKSKKGLLRI
ncbi:peptidyl-prolyl cis-trans isomerase FKBP3-like [Stigmatopora nigra]